MTNKGIEFSNYESIIFNERQKYDASIGKEDFKKIR